MTTFTPEKRKNTSKPSLQWWLLVAGFWLGVLATVIFFQSRIPTTSINLSPVELDAAQATATYFIEQATAQAALAGQVNPLMQSDPAVDWIAATATAIIAQATAQAAFAGQVDSFMTPDPAVDWIAATATAIIAQATAQAASGGNLLLPSLSRIDPIATLAAPPATRR